MLPYSGQTPRDLRTSVAVVTPTFEPNYKPNPALEQWYRENFLSFLNASGPYDIRLFLTDYASSDPFKEFLRAFARAQGERVTLLEGPERLPSYDAVNKAFRATDSDLIVYAASDCRTRDHNWLEVLADDFKDPAVMAVFPTVTYHGIGSSDQTQPEAIDKASKKIEFPNYCNLITVALRRLHLEPYGYRLGDRFPDGGAEEALIYQAAALDASIKVNFRCNIVHEQPKERYDRTLASHWSRHTLEEQNSEKRAVRKFLPVPAPRVGVALPWIEPLLSGWRSGGLRGVCREAYIRILQSALSDALALIISGHYLEHLFRFQRAKRQFEVFLALPRDSRMKLVNALFFHD